MVAGDAVVVSIDGVVDIVAVEILATVVAASAPFEALVSDGVNRFWGLELLSTLIVVFGLFAVVVAELGIVIGTIMVPVGVPLVVLVAATLRARGATIFVMGNVEVAVDVAGLWIVSVVVGFALSVFKLIV